MTDVNSKTNPVGTVPAALANSRDVITDLQKRITKLEEIASAIAGFIVVTIVCGFGVFVAAGTIAAQEQVAYYRAKSIEEQLSTNESKLQSIRSELEKIPKNAPELDEKLKTLGDQLEELVGSVKRLSASFPDILKDTEETSHRVLISSITTRVAAASLLAFLVVVLVNLYRYNVRLAAFYRSRADALLLAGHLEIEALEKTAILLSPDTLDIDKMPESPTKQVVDLLKNLAEVSRSK